jgi:tetratricopeptide (TPR) repeat protein
MKHLPLCIALISFAAGAQTYPKYTTQKKDTLIRKAETVATPIPEKSSDKDKVKPEPGATGNFQELMNKGGVQSVNQNHEQAINFFTQALAVSTQDTAWRALVSRATSYLMLKRFDKAVADYTTMINNNNFPDQKKLATTYMSRARAAAELKNMELACSDVQKARELGLPEVLITDFDCK